MKKKWPLFILIPLLLVLLGLLTIYIWKSPKRIKNESIGTEYSFQDIQFDMVSDDYIRIQELYEELEDIESENFEVYSNTDKQMMFITLMPDPDDLYIFYNELKDPRKIFSFNSESPDKIAGYSEYMQDNNVEISYYNTSLLYSDTKEIIYIYYQMTDESEHASLYILMNGKGYEISLVNRNVQANALEIIRTVNLKD